MHNTKSTSEFYRLKLILSTQTDLTNLSTAPPAITPLFQKYSMLFQNLKGLPSLL